MNNKKAVLGMSLSLVIYLIIGMVVLGLVIAYVTSMFSNAPEIPSMDKEKLESICNCADNLCVDPQPSMSVQKDDAGSLYLNVRAFDTPIDCGAGKLGQSGNCGFSYEVKNVDDAIESGITLVGPGFSAKDGGNDCQVYSLEVDGQVPIGNYYIKTFLYQGTNNEESKTITLTVE